jgi:hypothetical protein
MMIIANGKNIKYPKYHPSPSPFNIFLPLNFISSFISVFLGSCLGIIIYFLQKMMSIFPSILMIILLQKLPNYIQISF